MVIHLPHDHGGFGITSNVISRKATLYTATARFIAFVGTLPLANQSTWLPDNLGDPSTWTSPPLLAMRSIHEELIANYDCTEDQPSAQQRWLSSCPAGSPTRIVPAFRGCQALSTATELGISDPHSAGTEPDVALQSRHPPSRTPRPRSSPHSAAFSGKS